MKKNQIKEESNSRKPTLGFIGMGNMGSRMSRRLISAGYRLTAYDRTNAKAKSLEEFGASVVDTPAELASRSDVVLICVSDDAAQQQVTFGEKGALSALKKKSVIVDLSTVSPDASRRLYQAACEKGAAMIDAPVSGSLPQVDQGSLVIFVGGDMETYEYCKPILDVLGKSSYYLGASGMGTLMKLVVNTILGVGMQALAEAISLGEKAGLKKDQLLDVLEQTAVLTGGQKAKLANVRNGEYPTQFALSLIHKDLGLVLDQAGEVAVSMPVTAAAQQMCAAAMASGKNQDFSFLIEFMRKLAGLSN